MDLICNYLGMEYLVENLEWNGKKGPDVSDKGSDAGRGPTWVGMGNRALLASYAIDSIQIETIGGVELTLHICLLLIFLNLVKNAPKRNWYVGNALAGTFQTARNLTSVVVYNASHMVSVDQPRVTLDLLHRFLGVVDTALFESRLDDVGLGDFGRMILEGAQVQGDA
ncbi:Cell death protease [Quaeritorhiza haematococci]|nr:Cell death protease [Quaeritorhiza haematococci]